MAVEVMVDYGGGSGGDGFLGGGRCGGNNAESSGTSGGGNAAAMVAEESAVEEAAYAGLRSVEKLIRLLSRHSQHQQQEEHREVEVDCRAVADVAVTKFRKVISLLGRTRTGHARFRRAPLPLPYKSQRTLTDEEAVVEKERKGTTKTMDREKKKEEVEEPARVYCPKPIQQRLPPLPHHHNHHNHQSMIHAPSPAASAGHSRASSSLMTGDTMTTTTSAGSAFQVVPAAPASSAGGRPPLSSSSPLKRKCGARSEDGAANCGGGGASGRCHCSKRRKSRMRRTVRVPAISLKMADIPPDDFSWRKYGQKPIKGSPHPRGYYKCSSVRGCPARKHVERAVDDPTMLIVTYEGDHNHPTPSAAATSDGAPPPLLLGGSSS